MKTLGSIMLVWLLAIAGSIAAVNAQQAPSPPPTTPYGAPIGLEAAKKLMSAAEAEAAKNNWSMAIAILDSTGHIVMLHRMENTQYGSIAVAEDKARTALDFRRPSKVFEDQIREGRVAACAAGCAASSRRDSDHSEWTRDRRDRRERKLTSGRRGHRQSRRGGAGGNHR